MADNLEIRVEQLTDAIRGLYNKPSLTPAELNNAFNTMLQRFENQTNLGNEKLVNIMANEIKKVTEERQGKITETLYNFEEVIKSATTQMSNPKFEMEISKVSGDLSSIYSRLNNLDLQLQKFSQTVEAMRTSGTAAEMIKLSNDFATFSRGFDSITSTLNSNFAEFLTQVQSFSQKDELIQIRHQLDDIIKNSQTVIVAGDKIDALATRMQNISSKEDTNYINEKITILTSFLSDLKAYMEKNDLDQKEQLRGVVSNIEQKLSVVDFNTLNEVRADVKNLFEELRNSSSYSKDEFMAKFQNIVDIINKSYEDVGQKLTLETSNVNTSLAQLTGEIQKVYTTVTDGITGRASELKTNIETAVNAILKSNTETIDLSHDFIQSQIQKIEEILQKQEETEKQHLVNAIELLKNEFSQVSDRICSLEADLSGEGAQKTLEKINECVSSLQSSDSIKELSKVITNVTDEINVSIQSLKDNFERAQDGSSIQVLQQLSETIPMIADRLEVFRNHVVTENSANITELKQHFSQVIDTITSKVEQIADSVKDDVKNLSTGGLDGFSLSFQNMSNHIMESVETINEGIMREFNDHKVNIDDLTSKIIDYEEKFKDKLNSIESTFETLSQEGTDRINDSLSLTQLQVQETLASMKEDIVQGILGINKSNKSNFEIVDTKLESLIRKASSQNAGQGAVASLQASSQQELLTEIESKVERCNLQQIHNGKELLSEIQNLNSELSFKLENLHVQPNNEISPSVIRSIEDKVQSLLENSADREEVVQLVKAHMDLRIKEAIQKIAKIVSVFKPDEEREKDAQKALASVRLDELLSQLEYLKSNIFDEIKDGFNSLDKKEEIISDIAKNVGETLSNVVSLKNNLPNEFKSIVEDKLESLKNVEFLIEDVKNAAQNQQQSTLDRINSLNDDINAIKNTIVEDVVRNSLKLDDIRNAFNFDEIKGAIVHNVKNAVVDEIKNNVADDIKNTLASKVDTSQINVSEMIMSTVNGAAEDTYGRIETVVNQASERIASTILDNIKGSIVNIETLLTSLQKRKDGAQVIANGLNDDLAAKVAENLSGDFSEGLTGRITESLVRNISEMLKTSEGYSFPDVEADLTKLRFSIEKSNKNIGADFQNLGGWLKNTSNRLDGLTKLVEALGHRVEENERVNLEEIKTRLIQSEQAHAEAISAVSNGVSVPEIQSDDIAKEIAAVMQKKYKVQEMRLEELDEKISMLLQKQGDGFDVKQFIDIFYDNTTNTKSLVSRIDNLETKMNAISKNIERIISYIDE